MSQNIHSRIKKMTRLLSKPHQHLSIKLSHYGINGSAFIGVNYFMHNKVQAVFVNGYYSIWGNVTQNLCHHFTHLCHHSTYLCHHFTYPKSITQHNPKYRLLVKCLNIYMYTYALMIHDILDICIQLHTDIKDIMDHKILQPQLDTISEYPSTWSHNLI